MVASIVEGANTVTFLYDAEQSRAKKTDSNGTTYYYSGAGIKVEKVVGATLTTWNEYLYAGGEIIGQHYSKSDLSTYTYYFVNDHLGSVAVITDELGTVTERLSYDAWGKRRNSDGSDATTPIVSATMLGFTGHEMIDDVGLVNMNGRIYDPTIGRFMSADPFIQDVTIGQNLNRYTYVNNNPLSYTDPSGFFFKKLFRAIKKVFKAVKKFIRPILAIAAAAVFTFVVAPAIIGAIAGQSLTYSALTIGQQALVAGIGGGIGNIVATGKPKSFLTGFASGALASFIGSAFDRLAGLVNGYAPRLSPVSSAAGRALSHGVVSGALSEARGGKFTAGFLAAGFSSLAAPVGFSGDGFGAMAGNVAKSAIVGGVGSVLGGDKFASGAVTGSFTYLFNYLGNPNDHSTDKVLNRIRNLGVALRWALRAGIGSSVSLTTELLRNIKFTVYRVYDGVKAGPFGTSWTPQDPMAMENWRDMLAVYPAWNKGTYLVKGIVNGMDFIMRRVILKDSYGSTAGYQPYNPALGGGPYSGMGVEWKIPSAVDTVKEPTFHEGPEARSH